MSHHKSVCHITTAHPRNDTRIFLKQCQSLSSFGYHVSLIVNDGQGNSEQTGVRIVDLGGHKGRLGRALVAVPKAVNAALREKCDVYHFHDPELIPVGVMLAVLGKSVIYDVHEDLPNDIMDKPWIAPRLRRGVSACASVVERLSVKLFAGVVCATPFITERFKAMHNNVENINNYPIIGELQSEPHATRSGNRAVYVGGISVLRGILPVVKSLHNSNVKLDLLGTFSIPHEREAACHTPGWENVCEHGFADRQRVAEFMADSIAGIVTFLPCSNHVNAQPNKMFEYMSAGLPVICSSFPLWRDIVESHNCGICVDPDNPAEIAAALRRLCENPDLVREMGENGKKAVLTTFNWAAEASKLNAMYGEIK